MTVYGILAGGPDNLVPSLTRFNSIIDGWIGVDRGAWRLIEEGITPVNVFGDFDSITEKEKLKLKETLPEFDVYPKEKDETDLELAINWVIEKGADACLIFGVTGGRLDHELSAIHMLQKSCEANVSFQIIDINNILEVLPPGRHLMNRLSAYPYFSLISLSGEVKNLTLEGFKYPLKHAQLKQNVSLGISNELKSKEAVLCFEEGILLVIRSHD